MNISPHISTKYPMGGVPGADAPNKRRAAERPYWRAAASQNRL